MARGGIEPQCRYGHGRLMVSLEEGSEKKAGAMYFVPTLEAGRVDVGRGYAFEIWRCGTCSYIELHDIDPDAGQES